MFICIILIHARWQLLLSFFLSRPFEVFRDISLFSCANSIFVRLAKLQCVEDFSLCVNPIVFAYTKNLPAAGKHLWWIKQVHSTYVQHAAVNNKTSISWLVTSGVLRFFHRSECLWFLSPKCSPCVQSAPKNKAKCQLWTSVMAIQPVPKRSPFISKR